MELYLSSTKIDTYGDIYGLPFSFYGICIALAYGVMSQTYDFDCTGIVSFIGHNDAASHLVGYESRRHGIAIAIAIAIAFAL